MEFQFLSYLTEVPRLRLIFRDPFHRGLGTQVNLSTTFHPQTDGQAECTIQTLEDMLGACVLDFKGSLDDHFCPFLSLHTIWLLLQHQDGSQ